MAHLETKTSCSEQEVLLNCISANTYVEAIFLPGLELFVCGTKRRDSCLPLYIPSCKSLYSKHLDDNEDDTQVPVGVNLAICQWV